MGISQYYVNGVRQDETDTMRDYRFGLCSRDNPDTQRETHLNVSAGLSIRVDIH